MFIPEINSTNTYLKAHPELGQDEDLFALRTDYQTAGRGQLGNGWESERGKNLLCSLRWRNTNIPVAEAFRINEIVAVAIHRMAFVSVTDRRMAFVSVTDRRLDFVSGDSPVIKWPNDIYVGDKKLAGILVENSLCGGVVSESIIGIGLNVNQTAFASAPNPTSLALETGHQWDVEAVMQQVLASFREVITWPHTRVHETYIGHLYRKDGFYPYREREVSLQPTAPIWDDKQKDDFLAQIKDVTPQGELVLEQEDGTQKRYHFKQIQYILCKQ